jgi:hypothetical protein
VAGETLRPEAYRADVRRNSVDRHYGLDYQGDGTVINSSTASGLTARQNLRRSGTAGSNPVPSSGAQLLKLGAKGLPVGGGRGRTR